LNSVMPAWASPRPSPAPAIASRNASLMSCETTRQREAPSADRIATSLVRSAARARSRFATLAQATSSTPNTATSIVYENRDASARRNCSM
jgi:hypothetical protein